MKYKQNEGMIFNIQKFSIHDGPGIRTTVFFKGCNLRCFWCHNPESLKAGPELQVYAQKCIGCGRCAEVCPAGAHRFKDGAHVFDRDRCRGCGSCAADCCSQSLVLSGRKMAAEEVMAQVEADRAFYSSSGGGVTFSGGEPLLQVDFLKELLMGCRDRGIHTAVDTAGNVPWESFSEIIELTDLFLFDFKAFHGEIHLMATGSGNIRILENLSRLSAAGANIVIRIPVIRGINDAPDELEEMAGFIKGLENVRYTELLAFHRLAEGKYESLGMEYRAAGYRTHEKAELEALADIFRRKGLTVRV